MRFDWPIAIFAALTLIVTGAAAWILKFLVDLERALRLPKDKP